MQSNSPSSLTGEFLLLENMVIIHEKGGVTMMFLNSAKANVEMARRADMYFTFYVGIRKLKDVVLLPSVNTCFFVLVQAYV